MTLPEAAHFFVAQTTRFVSPMGLAAEWTWVAFAGLIVAVAPVKPVSRLARLRSAFTGLANRKRTAVVICGTLPIALRLAMLGFAPVPEPSIHDEFSHLLLADTFAHGRITNPTHPMWMHFESIHIIQRPTYTSMYPPGQGAFLAFGQVVFHEPWAGVLLECGLMFALICWMAQAWLPPEWALYGTLMAIFKIGLVGFWIDGYMGGSVAAIGGALVLGATPRLLTINPRTLSSVWLGLGIVFLMNTRPFEGAVLSACALTYLGLKMLKGTVGHRGIVSRIAVPAGVIVLAGLASTGYYSFRVTGNPLRMPYQVNRDTYGWPENLGILPPKKVALRHSVLRDMYNKEVAHRGIYHSVPALLENLVTRVFDNWAYLIGPILTIPLCFLSWILRERRLRPLLLFFGAILILNLFQMLLYPYHLAPVIPIVFVIVAEGTRRAYIRLERVRRGSELYFVLLLPLCLIASGLMKEESILLDVPLSSYWEVGHEAHREARASVAQWLRRQPGKHLVVVRYGPRHDPNQEWVYNGASIDESKIVWAREMDPESDQELLEYFSGRQAWLVEADVYPARVIGYEAESTGECPSVAADDQD